jgi:hypothetical protein
MRLAPQIMSTQLRARRIRKTDQCEAAHLAVGATPPSASAQTPWYGYGQTSPT